MSSSVTARPSDMLLSQVALGALVVVAAQQPLGVNADKTQWSALSKPRPQTKDGHSMLVQSPEKRAANSSNGLTPVPNQRALLLSQ